MRTKLSLSFFALCLFCLSLTFLVAPTNVSAGGDSWLPVDPADLALKTPKVEPDADAEAIFWEVRVADEAEGGSPRTVLNHYIRIKIFTERGRESQSKIDIAYFGNVKIKDIAARTIKPDGSIVELDKKDIYERTIVRAGGVKLKAKSFAMPGIVPGAIIEYRWREQRGDSLTFYDRLQLQRDIPVQRVKYYIKPLSLPGFEYGMRIQSFNGQGAPFVKEKDGFYSTTLTNIPAFHEEPRMPPEDQVRPWMLVYYAKGDQTTSPSVFWKEYGRRVYEDNKSDMKVNDDVRNAVAGIIGDASTPEQKLERLFEFCRSKIKNISDDASGMTNDERAKFKKNKSPGDTLKRGIGTGHDIDMLFAALANAAGFDARIANLADRSDTFFDSSFPDDYFMRAYDIAVRVGDGWRFYDPATTYVPFGMLRWQEEGQQALISDPKDPVWVQTPLSPPEKSMERRTATLRLSEDGTLEGDVRIEYTGHLAMYYKEYNDDDSPAQREETLRDRIKARMSTAEVTEIRIENVQDPVKPFVYQYHVRVPGYAQRTGKRLFLQPSFFEYGVGPLFAGSARKHDIYFSYPWSESDTVNIDLPAGFELDNAEAPAPFASGTLSRYMVKMQLKDKRTLIYTREFFFGGGGDGIDRILFPATGYTALKTYFDLLHKQDNHVVTLKQNAATAAN